MLNNTTAFRAGTSIEGFFFKVDFSVAQSRMCLDSFGNGIGTG